MASQTLTFPIPKNVSYVKGFDIQYSVKGAKSKEEADKLAAAVHREVQRQYWLKQLEKEQSQKLPESNLVMRECADCKKSVSESSEEIMECDECQKWICDTCISGTQGYDVCELCWKKELAQSKYAATVKDLNKIESHATGLVFTPEQVASLTIIAAAHGFTATRT